MKELEAIWARAVALPRFRKVKTGLQTFSLRGIPHSLEGYKIGPGMSMVGVLSLDPKSTFAQWDRFRELRSTGINFFLIKNFVLEGGDHVTLACGNRYGITLKRAGEDSFPKDEQIKLYGAFLDSVRCAEHFTTQWSDESNTWVLSGSSKKTRPYRVNEPMEEGYLYWTSRGTEAQIWGISLEAQTHGIDSFGTLCHRKSVVDRIDLGASVKEKEFEKFRSALKEDFINKNWELTMTAFPVVTFDNVLEEAKKLQGFYAHIFTFKEKRVGEIACAVSYDQDEGQRCDLSFSVEMNENKNQEPDLEKVVRELVGSEAVIEYVV